MCIDLWHTYLHDCAAIIWMLHVVVMLIPARCCLGRSVDHASAAREHYPAERDSAEHTGVCRVGRVSRVIRT